MSRERTSAGIAATPKMAQQGLTMYTCGCSAACLAIRYCTILRTKTGLSAFCMRERRGVGSLAQSGG